MRLTLRLFQIGMKQIIKDGILLMLVPAPFMMGLIFKCAIPVVNEVLENKFGLSISLYYGLFDGMLICLTPMFTAMVCAFLLLEERDEGISAYYQIAPTSGYPYLMARIGLPMLWAFAASVIAVSLFSISEPTMSAVFSGSIIGSLFGISLSMMVVSLADNRVEGLAYSKLMGISLLGLFIVWFVPHPFCYFVSFLPSFWIGKILMDGSSTLYLLFGLASSIVWIGVFVIRFLRGIR